MSRNAFYIITIKKFSAAPPKKEPPSFLKTEGLVFTLGEISLT